MKWPLVFLGIFQTVFCAESVSEVKISQVTFRGSGQGLGLCWIQGNADKVNLAKLTIIIQGQAAEGTFEAYSVTGSCAEFNVNLNTSEDDVIDFILNLFDGSGSSTPVGRGKAEFAGPKFFRCQHAYKVGTSTDVIVLRFRCQREVTNKVSLHGEEDNEEITCAYVSDGQIITYCFVRSQDAVTSANLVMCQDTDAILNDMTIPIEKLQICETQISIIHLEQVLTVNEASLDYDDVKTTVSVASQVSDKFEVINYWTDPSNQLSDICKNIVHNPEIPCKANSYTPGYKNMNILVVGYDAGTSITPVDTVTHVIHDMDLNGEFIFTNTLELRWTLPADAVGPTKFQARIPLDGCMGPTGMGSPLFTQANIYCSPGETGCFGYFINFDIAATRCLVSIDIYEHQEDTQPSGLNIIQSTIPKKLSKTKKNDLEIQNVKVSWHYMDAKPNITVCFNNPSNNLEISLPHYEFVMINKDGQWLKHKLTAQDAVGDLCFSPIKVNTEEFDITETVTLVVTQRTDDASVLASGGIQVNFVRNS